MALYHLMHRDPYAAHRLPGERDHLMDKIRKAGKFNRNPKYITPRPNKKKSG